ncbi:MAG: thermonuclease family protein [Nitrosomonas sp.]
MPANRLKANILILLILSFVSTISFTKEIYRSIDSQGRVTYSDQPSGKSQAIAIHNQPSRLLRYVRKVYDGDTIILEDGKHIRLLGVNTPEIESRQRAEEPGGVAAKKWLQAQLQDKKVYLEYDEVKFDKYKRQLAHVFLSNGKHLNLALLENGLGTVSIIPPNVRYSDKLTQAQQHAEKMQLGIWAMPEYQLKPIAQIANHAKGWQRFSATFHTIKKNRKYTRLLINDKIDIRISNQNLKAFPPLSKYLGKPLEIRGWVSRNNDHYTMLIQHPSSLIVR